MKSLVLLNIVGLSDQLLGEHTPHLLRLISQGKKSTLKTIEPAVTCSVQSSILTGKLPREHGIVGNGWYFRDLSEVWLWRQSNHLVQSPPFWQDIKKKNPHFKVAKLFWWYNMYSTADFSVTPRPSYHADGRKSPDIYTSPPSLRSELTNQLGNFPLFQFWGPMANIISSEWIAQASKYIFEKYNPNLTLIYLPHLDYNLQKLGPNHPAISKDLQKIDQLVGELIDFFLSRDAQIVALSEYAILPVTSPVPINQILRKAGYIQVHHNYVGELLDCGASKAFSVSDHQIAHVYIQNSEHILEVKQLLESTSGIAQVLTKEEQIEIGLNHYRSGELVALADFDRWFSYYYWLEEEKAPDFARTVDIHNKPGYDPLELFLDPDISFVKLKILGKLLKKKLGFRTLMDLIPIQGDLVRGSHGRVTKSPMATPLLITSSNHNLGDTISVTDLAEFFLELLS